MATYIDIGNTNIKIMDEKMSMHAFSTKGFDVKSITTALLGSDNIVIMGAVPDVVNSVAVLCQSLDKKVSIINPRSKFSFNYSVDGVGIDRLVAIEGGITAFDPPFVVIDAGTAITVDFVTKENSSYVFKGGVIIPGLELCFKTLNDHAPMLPRLKPMLPKGNYGRDTMNAMNCGICFTVTAGIKDIIEKTKQEFGLDNMRMIVTGGAGKFLGELLQEKHDYVDNLMFRGMMNIYNGRGV